LFLDWRKLGGHTSIPASILLDLAAVYVKAKLAVVEAHLRSLNKKLFSNQAKNVKFVGLAHYDGLQIFHRLKPDFDTKRSVADLKQVFSRKNFGNVAKHWWQHD